MRGGRLGMTIKIPKAEAVEKITALRAHQAKTIHQIAAEVGLSPTHVSRICIAFGIVRGYKCPHCSLVSGPPSC